MVFSKYSIYEYSDQASVGLKQIIDYSPIILCLFFDFKNKTKNQISKVAFAICVVGFFVAIMSYSLENMLRAYTFFVYIFIIYVPAIIYCKTAYSFKYKVENNIPLQNNWLKIFFVFYLLYRLIQYTSQMWISTGFYNVHFLF